MKRLALLTLIVLVLAAMRTDTSTAQTNQRSLLSVEPAQLNLEFDQNATEASSIVVVTNQHGYPVRMKAEFQAIDEEAGRIIPASDLAGPLEQVLQLSEPEFEVPAESRYFLTVTAIDTVDLQPGGHYASLVLEDISDSTLSGTIRSQVSIGVFVVKKQGEVRKVVATDKTISRSFLNFPKSIRLELLNDGNVHVVPRGYIKIFDNNFVYHESILNANSVTILPNKRYLEEQSISIQDSGWLPKKINIEIGYRAEGTENYELYAHEFWYVPQHFMPIPLAFISIIAILLLSYSHIKTHFIQRQSRQN